MKKIEESTGKLVKKEKLTEQERGPSLPASNHRQPGDLAKRCDLVIEAATEGRQLKYELFRSPRRALPPRNGAGQQHLQRQHHPTSPGRPIGRSGSWACTS